MGTYHSQLGNKTVQGGSLLAKHNSIMQQLTLQFDGYAPLGTPVNVGSTKQNKSVLSQLRGKVSHVTAAAKAALPLKRIGEAIFAAASVVGGFALMFFAALIQG